MTSLMWIFASVFVAVSTTVVANEVPEVLHTSVLELQNVKLPELFNSTTFRFEPSDHPHAHLNVLELAAYYDYKAEKHEIRTSDDYYVEVHRITGNRKNPKPDGKPSVFLMHGLLCSSMDWVVTGPERGLGFILADAGYDVWMGNARGNAYSLRHKRLSLTDPEYWQFSWHEIGIYDLPATIDHILKTTGNEKITYIGHSQGSTAFLVMLSERPEYNDKIKMMFSLAPIAYCSHMTSPVFKTLGALMPVIDVVFKLIGKNRFEPGNDFFQRFAAQFCKDGHVTLPVCKNVIFLICGYSEEQLDTELLPAILAHVPAGSSTKQFSHYAHLVNSGHFRQFDYGWWTNYKKYGKITPPFYKFENMKVPISLHYSVNDYLSDPYDVEKLHSKLPNTIGKFRVPHEKFNHLDYLWGKDVKHLVYDKILTLMTRYKD